MPNFKKWQTKQLSPNSLYLDSQNPRLSSGKVLLNQRDVIQALIDSEKVLKLSEEIANLGYFPTEVLVAVDEDGKLIVIEGNRRLAALKLLLNPELAPDHHSRQLKALSRAADLPTKIQVTIAPSRDDAVPILLSRHTQTPVERWSPAMQAGYMRRLLDEGSTVKSIAAKHGITQTKIEELLHLDHIYQLACSVDVSPEAETIVRDPHQFPLTNLERLMSSTDVRNWLGISRTPAGRYTANTSKPQFEKAFSKIVEDVALGNVDSRSAHNAKRIKKYLDEIGDLQPKRKGRFDPSKLIPKDKKPPASRGTTKKPASRQNHKLLPRSLSCDSSNRRVKLVFEETGQLSAIRTPNTYAVMLRVLAELSLSDYLEQTGEMKGLLSELRSKRKSGSLPRDHHPSLPQMLDWFIENGPVEGAGLKALRQLASDRFMSLETLNAYVHNPHSIPTERELESLTAKLVPMLSVTLCPLDED